MSFEGSAILRLGHSVFGKFPITNFTSDLQDLPKKVDLADLPDACQTFITS